MRDRPYTWWARPLLWLRVWWDLADIEAQEYLSKQGGWFK